MNILNGIMDIRLWISVYEFLIQINSIMDISNWIMPTSCTYIYIYIYIKIYIYIIYIYIYISIPFSFKLTDTVPIDSYGYQKLTMSINNLIKFEICKCVGL